MVGRWNLFGFRVLCVALMFHIQIDGCWSINVEGLALLEFRAGVKTDPYGAFANWNASDSNPCKWSGVYCVDGNIQILDLKNLSLEGILSPELGKLSHLRALVLHKNHFFGVIPKEIAELTMLELLDLRANNLSGTIPPEIGNMLSLKYLLLCDNKFQGSMPTGFGKFSIFEEQCDQNCTKDVAWAVDCLNLKLRHRFKLKDSLHGHGEKFYNSLASTMEMFIQQNKHLPNPMRRRLLQESTNLAAVPISGAPSTEISNFPSFGSGSFPALLNSSHWNGETKNSPKPASSSPISSQSPPIPSDSLHEPSSGQQTQNKGSISWNYVYVVPAGAIFLTITAAMICLCQRRQGATVGPWKTGLSGQLQKAFVTGVPRLNRAELETACEDFSNIIGANPDCTLFKGTLSSGVEIAVASTSISSTKDWSKRSQTLFRRKIDTLSRINHKNFVNLLGYCEEDEPFLRMLVFEYAPSGTLFERLHAKGAEHLDWTARLRVIMGVAYCLQYMHHDLNPPISHPNLTSKAVYLTDDNAAKIAEIGLWKELIVKGQIPDDTDPSELPLTDPENDVYDFGILLLEIISGKLPYSEEQGSLVNLAIENLNEKRSISYMVDTSLKSFKNNELDVICQVIQQCIHQEPRQRPTMKEVVTKLKEVIAISPDAATPKLSPLWWAELEILSVEAS